MKDRRTVLLMQIGAAVLLYDSRWIYIRMGAGSPSPWTMHRKLQP